MCECVKLWQDKDHLWQWDIDQRVELDETDLSLQVHFVHNGEVLAVGVYEEEGKVYADIPNILLQMAGKINGWVYRPGDSASTTRAFSFIVSGRERPPEYVYTATEILTWYQLEERIEQLEQGGMGGSGDLFIVELQLDENENPVTSHTREEVLAAIRERKFVVLRAIDIDMFLDPYPPIDDPPPDDAELRFSRTVEGDTFYAYWTVEGVFPQWYDWATRYMGLVSGYHTKTGTSHLIENVPEAMNGFCSFAFIAQGDYRTGDTFTIRFYVSEEIEPYDVKVTPKLWNMEDLPDQYFTTGAMVNCICASVNPKVLYFMGGKDGIDGKTPEKGTDYFTEADKAELINAVIAALPVYNGEVVTV